MRRVATARLEAMSGAIVDYLEAAVARDGSLGVRKNGRPAAWCVALLHDVAALRNVDVVDDEEAVGPGWLNARDADGRRVRPSADILDPDFKQWNVPGSPVVGGYVALRWRNETQLVLQTLAACTMADDGSARCNPERYVGIRVHEEAAPPACDVVFIGRSYWPNWIGSMTPLDARLPSDHLRKPRRR